MKAKTLSFVPEYGEVIISSRMAMVLQIHARSIKMDDSADKCTQWVKLTFGVHEKEVMSGSEFNKLVGYIYRHQAAYFHEFINFIRDGSELLCCDLYDGALRNEMARCVFDECGAHKFLWGMEYLHSLLYGKNKGYTRIYEGMISGQRCVIACDVVECLESMMASILGDAFPPYAYDRCIRAYRNMCLIAELGVTVSGLIES